MTIRRLLALLVILLATLVSGCGSSQSPTAETTSATAADSTAADSTSEEQQAAAETTIETAEGSVRYLALGDSLTQGVGAPDESTGSFPAQLAQRWRDAGCEVQLQNVGISGYTTAQILDEQVPVIEEFAPTFITFQAGGNDIAYGVTPDEYRTNVAAILDAATASGARVAVFVMNDWLRSPAGAGYSTEDVREEFDAVLIEEAGSRGVEFVDLRPLYTQQADENMWVEDGLHPTAEAYEQWADEMAAAIPAPCS